MSFEPLKYIDALVNRWLHILVPIFTNKEYSNNIVQLIGTAFIAEFKGKLFLITAHHVIKDFKHKLVIIQIGEKAIALEKFSFIFSADDDIAVAFLDPKWAEKNNLSKVKYVKIDKAKDDFHSLNTFFLIGYPGNKNILNTATGKIDKKIQGTSFFSYINSPISKTHIQNPVGFKFDRKQAILTDGTKTIPPKFNGNSGGPILEMVAKLFFGGSLQIGVKFAGIFIGWHKIEREAIAARPESLISVINENYFGIK